MICYRLFVGSAFDVTKWKVQKKVAETATCNVFHDFITKSGGFPYLRGKKHLRDSPDIKISQFLAYDSYKPLDFRRNIFIFTIIDGIQDPSAKPADDGKHYTSFAEKTRHSPVPITSFAEPNNVIRRLDRRISI